jgi:hypothetical protein
MSLTVRPTGFACHGQYRRRTRVITLQKFIAELQMLRTRAKELGLPITAHMIGRVIEVCERERGGDFFTVKRIEPPEVRGESPDQPV